MYTIENEYIKVTVQSQYGGRVSSIYDKVRNRETLYNNKVHQPANIGARKAWTAGGAEWNWSPGIIGHSAFTEQQIFLAEVDSVFGPSLRIYEFDRYNSTVWQVDLVIVNDTLYAHPTITNPTDKDLRGYWWTCVAVESKPTTRILTPAKEVIETSRLAAALSQWPYLADAIENASFVGHDDNYRVDNSYLANHPSSGDYFFRIDTKEQRPFIAHTDDDGFVFVHGHNINGTKLWSWGNSGPGRFMQDFLAGGVYRGGDYTELQIGPALTQMQTFPLPKNSNIAWTEYFKGFDADKSKLLHKDYDEPIKVINDLIENDKGVNAEVYNDMDAFFVEQAKRPPSKILTRGSPWGALEEKLLGHQLLPGLAFELPGEGDDGYYEAQPWVELLRDGTFSDATLSMLPLSYQTTDNWLDVLMKSSTEGKMTWLHALHIGICLTERGLVTEPLQYFQTSMDMKPNPIAARCIAVLQKTTADAWTNFNIALSILDQWKDDASYSRLQRNMINEVAIFLQATTYYDDMSSFINTIPQTLLESLDAVLELRTILLIYQRDYDGALTILSSNCFPTYATERIDLMNLWNSAVEGKANAVTQLEKHIARTETPIPRNIGCNKGSKYCLNYWR